MLLDLSLASLSRASLSLASLSNGLGRAREPRELSDENPGRGRFGRAVLLRLLGFGWGEVEGFAPLGLVALVDTPLPGLSSPLETVGERRVDALSMDPDGFAEAAAAASFAFSLSFSNSFSLSLAGSKPTGRRRSNQCGVVLGG